MIHRPRSVIPAAVLCLLVSGATGLLYQVVWMRYLSLFLGTSSHAVLVVLVSFMGGLAIGNAWFGAWSDRVHHPFAFYGWLEIAVGVYALLFPYYYEVCHSLYLRLASQAPESMLPALKWAVGLATILPPTMLMGGTLPVMARLVSRSVAEVRNRVSTLYAANSGGAVAGCFLSEFWWIPVLGLPRTLLLGAFLNLAVGILAITLSRRGRGTLVPVTISRWEVAGDIALAHGDRRLVILGVAVSGFTAMLYEVAWTRILALSLGSGSRAFALMLMTFIGGIATGAYVIGRRRELHSDSSPLPGREITGLKTFGWLEIVLGAAVFVSLFFHELIPFVFVKLSTHFSRQAGMYLAYELTQAAVCCAVMFIPTLLMGMTLPLVSRIATQDVNRTGRSVGTVFSANLAGTVLGVILTGLWLMPWLGLPRLLGLGVALNVSIGILVLARRHLYTRPPLALAVPSICIALGVVIPGILEPTWRGTFAAGLWRQTPDLTWREFRGYGRGMDLKYYRDGPGATVSVNTSITPRGEQLVLRVNGKPDASTLTDRPTQWLVGHIPLLLLPSAKQVLVVGLGSGMTCAAILRHPVERLDVVEISPEVVEAARLFDLANDRVLDHPRAHLILDDARSFLQITRRTYDIVVSQPSNPWVTGMSSLFTREFYLLCRARLDPGGFMAQWVHAYEMDDPTLQLILNTFASVFPSYGIWQTSESDLLLIGVPHDFKPTLTEFRQRFDQPSVRTHLEQIVSLPLLLARELTSPAHPLHTSRHNTRLHTDFHPVLDHAAQRAFFLRNRATFHLDIAERQFPRPRTLLADYLETHPLTETDVHAFVESHRVHGLPDAASLDSLLRQWQHDHPESTLPAELASEINP